MLLLSKDDPVVYRDRSSECAGTGRCHRPEKLGTGCQDGPQIKIHNRFYGIRSLHDQIRKVESNAKNHENLERMPDMVGQVESVVSVCIQQLRGS
jgi:hypothetical protein